MDQEEIFGKIANAVVEGDEEWVEQLTKDAVKAGLEPLKIINEGLTRGIQNVGELFASGEYFLPDLVLGAKAMEAGLKILEPMLVGSRRDFLGRVLIGTVQGDLHEIGKNIVAMMLKASGFEVFDLGVDVPSEVFINKVKELNPDIIGISALLTTTVHRQREIIDLLEAHGIRDRVKVLIGGAPINQEWAQKIGADGYAEDASGAVTICKELVS